MGILSRTSDAIYALRFVKLLTTPWEKTKAYKAGIIDDQGKVIRKPMTSEEKSVYNHFHRLVFNIKRLVSKASGGSKYIAAYAAALMLLKEHTGMSEYSIISAMEKVGVDIGDENQLIECFYIYDDCLLQGVYTLKEDAVDLQTYEVIAKAGTKVRVSEHARPKYTSFNANIYEVFHENTRRLIYVTAGDLIR